MATFVFRLPNSGPLQQIQAGPVDIVATIAAAYSAWGWFNGLGGVKAILDQCRRPIEEKRRQELFNVLVPTTGSFRILVQQGLASATLPEGPRFGQSHGSQLVSMTICALAYNIQPFNAVAFFMDYLAPTLFADVSGESAAKETLHTFLIDKVQMILNEGDVLGLNRSFERAISSTPLLNTQKPGSRPPTTRSPEDPDAVLIPAFLLWLGRGINETYYTRSAAVARICICLKAVGYRIDEFRVWDGTGPCPHPRRSLVLVTGGSSKTDSLQDDEEIDQFYRRSSALITHYRQDTIGAMLWNSFPQQCNYGPETFQQDYQEINDKLSKDLKICWSYLDIHSGEIQAHVVWLNDEQRQGGHPARALATRLATFYFPESVDHIAPYYEPLANQRYVDAAKKYAKKGAIWSPCREIERFYTFTASICLAIVECFAGPEFRELRHATTLGLGSDRSLAWLCSEIDSILSGASPTFSKVVSVVAALHCGGQIAEHAFQSAYSPKEDLGGFEKFITVGRRNGVYSVLPRVLYSLDQPLEPEILGIRCMDEFIANIPTRPDGSVVCSTTLPLEELQFSHHFFAEAMEPQDLEEQALTPAGNVKGAISFGPPLRKAPDKRLYLSIERPPRYAGEPILALCGRVDGEAMGYVGIPQVLSTLALSWGDESGSSFRHCAPSSKHDKPRKPTDQLPADQVFNIPASMYGRNGAAHPLSKFDQEPRHHSYIQVYGDPCWTIYLAGQSTIFHRVVFGCPGCAANAGAYCNSSIAGGLRFLIGYQ